MYFWALIGVVYGDLIMWFELSLLILSHSVCDVCEREHTHVCVCQTSISPVDDVSHATT